MTSSRNGKRVTKELNANWRVRCGSRGTSELLRKPNVKINEATRFGSGRITALGEKWIGYELNSISDQGEP